MLAEARLAREMDPVRTDALDGTIALQNIALAYALVGENADALEILVELERVPARLTPALVRIDPLWDGLRNESRYATIVRQPVH